MAPVHDDIAAVARELAASTVQVKGDGVGGGSGIVWHEGVIVTNAHVARQDRLWVQTTEGKPLQARVTSRDVRRDLALLRTEGALPKPAVIGDSSRLRAGELVIAVGHPLGIVNAASVGVVHSTPDRRWIRSDVKLAPGNSGGPLADAHGRVIGVNSMIASGLAMAVPGNAVARFLQGGRRRIGVTLQSVVVAVEAERRFGLLILETEPGSAAERSGLLTGDVILAIDGRALTEPDDLSDALESGPVSLEWLRGGGWMRAVVQAESQARREAA